MCGICGFNWDDKNLVNGMMDSLVHRGPDDSGYYTDKNISLGHRRLSIIDLSQKGKQPIYNEDKTICVVYNGEIYNFQEIKSDLEKKRHKFYSNTDTEVIVHAYEEYGERCLEYFNGMFAFAIWDSKQKKLFLARDRLGKKFLYYYHKDGKFMFASEIKALLQYPDIKRQLNRPALSQFIFWAYTLDGSTLFKDIHELKPGHYMVYDGKNLEVKKYWDIQDKLKTISKLKDESYYVKKLRNLLIDAVRMRLISDVPLGASLSGGIDSSLVVGLMNHLKEGDIKTYTVGFGREDDEFPYAKAVAEHCNAEYNEIVLSYDDMTKIIPQVLWNLEVPWARPSLPAMYLLFKEIKKAVTVNLIGEGSDELFAGYNRYHVYAPKPDYSSIYEKNDFNKKWWRDFESYEKMGVADKIGKITSGYFNDKAQREDIFTQEILDDMPEDTSVDGSFGKVLRKTEKENYLNAALCFEAKASLPGVQLIKLDKLPMASSLEVRAPYIDYNVAEFSMEIPPVLKWNGLNKKYIIQKVAAEFIPKRIFLRRKLPFQVPLADYFKKDFIDVIQQLLSTKSTAKRDYLNKNSVGRLLNKFKSNPDMADNSLRQLLFLTNLELWQRMFIENDNFKNPSLDINDYV